PERGRAEPAFQDFEGAIDYNYKITKKELISLFRKKTISALIISMLFTGIAMSTLSNWAIYYFTLKLRVENADFYATTIYLVAGIGALPGTLMGGRIGDKYVKAGNSRGKVKFSIITLFSGILFFMGFYLIPINPTSTLKLVMIIILIILLGFLGFFLTTLRLGNIQSIYSDVCEPEKRSTAIALNGLMFNLGGITGNLLLSNMIEIDISLLPLAFFLVLIIWLLGSLTWIVVHIFYLKEAEDCKMNLEKRRVEIENQKQGISFS
ncbi:MAG: MFS transporter, partial [Promethearchaeota archaeon]